MKTTQNIYILVVVFRFTSTNNKITSLITTELGKTKLNIRTPGVANSVVGSKAWARIHTM